MIFRPLITTLDYLAQDTFWRGSNGRVEKISDMHYQHLRSVIPALHRRVALGEIEGAPMDDPQGWLALQPCMQAMLRELARREGYEWN